MSASEVVFGSLLVVALLGISLYYGWRQLETLRSLGGLPEEERRYERRKAYLRLTSCLLTLLMAVLIAALLVMWDSTAGQVNREREGVDPSVPITDEQRFLVRVWIGTWIAALLLLLAVLVLAGVDLWATRRFGQSQYRKIAGDRRAMIKRQLSKLREEKNGHA